MVTGLRKSASFFSGLGLRQTPNAAQPSFTQIQLTKRNLTQAAAVLTFG